MKISEIKDNFVHVMPITKKFLELLTLPGFDTQGVLTFTQKIGHPKLTELVEKALKKDQLPSDL
jgi:hypothetical protein